MSSSGSPEKPKRSKGGCYNCRVRKVKCTRPSQDLGDQREQKESCQNCSRLHFECRWTPPAPGEAFTPPPKRRRTVRKESEARSHGGHDVPVVSDSQGAVNGESTGLSVFGLPSDEAGPSSTAPLPNVAGSTEDFNALWGDLFDLGDMPAIPMDWNQALDIVLPQQSITEIPDLSPYSAIPLPQPTVSTASFEVPTIDWTADNHPLLIRHYLEVMKGYAKVEDRDRDSNNVYISAFTRALTLPPLYNAILAYSASHISLNDPSYTDQSNDLARLAFSGVEALSREEHIDEPEAILSAIFILVKREHMLGTGLTQCYALLEIAAGIVERPATLEAMMRDPRCFAKRIVQRLLLIESRASILRLGGGFFGERMKRIDPLADVFLHREQSSSADLLRATLLRQRVGDLDRRLHIQLHDGLITNPPVHRTEINSLRREIEDAIHQFDDRSTATIAPMTVDSNRYNRYIVASLLHSALVYMNLIYPLPSDDPEKSIRRILEMHLQISRDPSRKHSPGAIWPSSLFFAGVAAEDAIHQDWILEQFRKAESWGHNIKKARQLLEVIMERRRTTTGIDIGAVMREVTGEFIL